MPDIPFAQRARLIWIDHQLASGQLLRRADIEAAFQISTVSASLDIRAYERLHPGKLRYDKTAKGYTFLHGCRAAYSVRLRIAVQAMVELMAERVEVAA